MQSPYHHNRQSPYLPERQFLQVIDPVCGRHTAVLTSNKVLLKLSNGPDEPEVMILPRHKKFEGAGMKATTKTKVRILSLLFLEALLGWLRSWCLARVTLLVLSSWLASMRCVFRGEFGRHLRVFEGGFEGKFGAKL